MVELWDRTEGRIGAPPPTRRPFLICCDESGINRQQYYAFGSLWMPWDRRGDFSALMRRLMEKHHTRDELKWERIRGKNASLYMELLHEFFKRRWMMFHCIVVKRADVRAAEHAWDRDLAMRKHFAFLLAKKIEFFANGCPEKEYRIHVDPLPSRYRKADEAAHVIVNNMTRQVLGRSPIVDFQTKDSRESFGIQLSDVLLGATLSDWQTKQPTAGGKLLVRAELARLLGWDDMRAATYTHEWKFNIWYLQNPQKRAVMARPLRFHYPVPKYERTC